MTNPDSQGRRGSSAAGFALANKAHDTRALQAYLGHRNIQHTVRYTELSPGRRLTEERLEFAVRQFDWIEVGRHLEGRL